MAKVGSPPVDLGYHDLNPVEMMFWLYCPIKIPYGQIYLPDNLMQFTPLVQTVLNGDYVGGSYIYITAKTLWVSGDYVGNRPGWHCDGFGTDDLNYIWYDRAPTQFIYGEWEVSDDCDISMMEMEKLGAENAHYEYPAKILLRLDPAVIHRSPVAFEPGMRTFVKISVSKNKYDLAGNSINHKLQLDWDLKNRKPERNHPSSET